MTEPQLEPELERVALALLRHLEWQESGFSLSFLFVDFGTSQRLAHWVNERLRLQDRPLQRHEVEQSDADRPEDMVDRLVEMASPRNQPLWFGFQKFAADHAWNEARCRFLARLNERRFLLEKQFARPLVLVLPAGFREQTRNLAPDIWHVRTMSEEIKHPSKAAKGSWAQSTSQVASDSTPVRAETPVPAYDDWVRIRGLGRLDRMDPTAAARVVRELLAAGRPGDARRVAEEALDFVHKREGPNARRELMIANSCIGDVAWALRDWSGARRAYGEALEISKQIHREAGGSTESARDLSVSLNNIGHVAEAQSEWKLAGEVYQESLAIRRGLQARLGWTSESMGDLSISLNNIGRVAEAQSEWKTAEEAYRESLEIRRKLQERLGETPESLRGMSVSLANIGHVAEARSDLKVAEEAYLEGLKISRALRERLGGTPQSMRDLSVSLNNIGRMVEAKSEWKAAEHAYRESLEISRALQERLGGTPESLRDLLVALDSTGRVAASQLNWKTAEEAYRESLEISRALKERLRGTPESLRDLSVSLDNLGRVAEANSEWKAAEEVYRESLEIRRGLQERLGGTPRTLADLRFSLQSLERVAKGLGDLDRAAALAAEVKAIEDKLGGKVSEGAA